MGPLTDLLTTFAHTWWAAAQAPGTWQGLWTVFTRTWLFEATFYFAAALLMWALLHGLLRRRLAHRLINGWPSSRDLRREVTYSISTLAVFAALGLLMWGLAMTGHIEVYANPAKHGPLWLWASLPALILWHDTWFYWTHRLLHTRWLFRHVHGVHHRSRQPSPWAAYAFHPVEALIQALVTPLALAVVPVHGGVLMLFQLHQILRNTHGHAAVETMPTGFTRHWLGRLFTTTTHHHLHHEFAHGNYALWFTFWDRWCGTLRPDYSARFEATCSPRHQATSRVTDARSSHERPLLHGAER
jgi:sterol desaturase/sphingolipid hydroxylase (fatty acid hydroxylase superfamily)